MRSATKVRLTGAEIDSAAVKALKIYRPWAVEYGEVLEAIQQGYDTVARLAGVLVVEVQTMRRVMRALERAGVAERRRIRPRPWVEPDEASFVDVWSITRACYNTEDTR